MELYQRVSSRGGLQVRGRFELGEARDRVAYDLSVTDAMWERAVRFEGNRTVHQTDGKFLVTVSLGEPLDSHCYKVIAAIVLLPEELGDLL